MKRLTYGLSTLQVVSTLWQILRADFRKATMFQFHFRMQRKLRSHSEITIFAASFEEICEKLRLEPLLSAQFQTMHGTLRNEFQHEAVDHLSCQILICLLWFFWGRFSPKTSFFGAWKGARKMGGNEPFHPPFFEGPKPVVWEICLASNGSVKEAKLKSNSFFRGLDSE